ncbi:MAG: hypothetical protein PVF87_02335 [Acidimicrobiia bacterium]
MRKRGPPLFLLAMVVSLVALAGCADGGSGDDTTPTITPTSTRPAPTTSPLPGPGVMVSPEFIQGAIPGESLVLLVAGAYPDGSPVEVAAEVTNGRVTVEPSTIEGAEIEEVTVVPDPTDAETTMSIEIQTSQDGDTTVFSREVNVLPWEDDRGGQASEILTLFTAWLDQNRPELGISPDTEFEGTFLAPELLVVSHYGFFYEQWELGLSWHVMLPPDDFAELYLRRRTELYPSLAFRIGSWQNALESGSAEVIEIDPPAEVVR